MTSWDEPAFWGEKWADIYDGDDELDPTSAVDFLAPLAGGGRALELAIGTGRVALPLAARGVRVEGIDGSPSMVERMRTKPGGDLPVVVGDMADVAVDGPFSLVFVVYNSLFNLPNGQRQADTFAGVTRVLESGGLFVLECFVPDPTRCDRGQRVETLDVTENSAVLELTRHDAAAQRSITQKVLFTPRGIRLLPTAIRYAWPSELDLMARLAGLELRERYADWDRTPFGSDSRSHISVYAKP